MKQETKIVKGILKYHFPESKFSLRYETARDYSYTADKLHVILCDNTVSVKDVICTLKKYVFRISVIEKRDVAFATEKTAYLKQTNTNEVYEVDELRFIIVEHKKGVRQNNGCSI